MSAAGTPSPDQAQSSNSLQIIAEPFSSVNPDIVLRSPDGVDFRVTKSVLAEASPVFRDMFSQLQGLETTVDGHPIQKVTESSRILDSLLRICFPVKNPDASMKDLELIDGLLVAGRKYAIDAVEYEAKRALGAPEFSDASVALKVYALACRFKLAEEARKAARDTLKGPRFVSYSPELEDISAGALHRLQDYHRRVPDAILKLFSASAANVADRGKPQFAQCSRMRACGQQYTNDFKLSAWWKPYSSIAMSIIKDSDIHALR